MTDPASAGPIAVFDVETTGLFPARHDRVVEVAAVLVRADGRVEREFVSVVNPGRDVGPTRIHGLSAEDVQSAPAFGEVIGHLLDAVAGCVAIAGHNVRFDRQFLEAEFGRLGHRLPDAPSLCTLELGWGGSLADCCRDYGVAWDGEATPWPTPGPPPAS